MLEADFQRFYQLDLAQELGRSPRRVLSLAASLPPESMLVRKLLGDRASWDWTNELLAAQLELAHDTMRLMAAGFGVKKHRIPKEFRMRRPELPQPPRPKRRATIDEVMGKLGPMLGGPHG